MSRGLRFEERESESPNLYQKYEMKVPAYVTTNDCRDLIVAHVNAYASETAEELGTVWNLINYGSWRDDKKLYIVLPHMPEKTLEQFLAKLQEKFLAQWN